MHSYRGEKFPKIIEGIRCKSLIIGEYQIFSPVLQVSAGSEVTACANQLVEHRLACYA